MRTRAGRRIGLVLVTLLGLLAAGGFALARSAPSLSAGGPTSVAGTEATGVFEIADRTVRQVRYDDGGTLRYTFELTNDDRFPVTVHGLAADQPPSRLFTYSGLADAAGRSTLRLSPGESVPVTLSLLMGGCETLSARAGAFVTAVVLRIERAGMLTGLPADNVTVTLPEELHTGSPREAFCPNSTATSRPPG
ncbi:MULTISPECIES: hypothetical protein [unclassified Nocardioides]|uniref:hypothetical protein n=1 Tax=unclassified Nocardioides TaxID=2615069 RepID=UPI000056FE7F|nr:MULTISPECIES: hypothetical protein [unclassified Nocardioides]ABL81290.1 hypothetical protein Noca_1777 [Nocardioides sp. JS614]